MLTERRSFTDDNGNITTITVDEILEAYEIKDLKLEELQEKYVNIVDEYEEKIDKYEEKINELNNVNEQFLSLTETLEELKTENNTLNQDNTTSFLSFCIVFIIGVFIAFLIGKFFQKNNTTIDNKE
mgnify:FL=1